MATKVGYILKKFPRLSETFILNELLALEEAGIEVECLAGALEELEALDERKADVVKLRVIWGLKMEEITESLGVSMSRINQPGSKVQGFTPSSVCSVQPGASVLRSARKSSTRECCESRRTTGPEVL